MESFLALLAVGGGPVALYYVWRSFQPTLRQRELAALQALYDYVRDGELLDADEIIGELRPYFEKLEVDFNIPLRVTLRGLVREEQFTEVHNLAAMDLAELLNFRKRLFAWELKRMDGKRHAVAFLEWLILFIGKDLPKLSNPSPFTVPLSYTLPNAKSLITETWRMLNDDIFIERQLFEELRHTLYENICYASDVDPKAPGNKKCLSLVCD